MNPNHSQLPDSKFTRRDFIKTTSTAAIGGTFAGALAGCSSSGKKAGVVAATTVAGKAFAQNDGTLKIALIGCGGRGSGAANQALSADSNLTLVAVVDAFQDRLEDCLKNLRKEHGDKVAVPEENKFVGFDGYIKAIALADVVILATPPGFRPIHFEEAVKQGKHVFMEKPVAVDAPGVRRVLAAAEEAKKKNLKVGVGLQRHHQLGYLETLDRLHGGAIGDIVAMRCYWNGGGVWVRPRQTAQTEMEYQMRNWYYFNWLCGDHINEQHIHNLDVINWVKNGHPVRCHGMGGRQVRTGIDHGEIFDHHAVEYEYADGSHLFSQCEHIEGVWSSVSEHVIGTKGTCDVSSHVIRGANAWKFEKDGARDPYQQEHDDLFKAIRSDKPYNEAENGAKSTLTAIMGRMATYSGKVIEWDEALNSKIDLMPKVFAWDANPPTMPDKDGRYAIAIPGKTIAV
ncbi:MAG: Gfo/Idh/MocA family oxidoreductase [Verrucomicrobiota bacterium]